MSVGSSTVLRRVPELLVEVDSAHQVRIHHDRRIFEFGQHAMSLLDVFYEPRSVAEGIQRLRPRLTGHRAVEELIGTLTAMVNSGILTTDAPDGYTDLMFPIGGYGLAYLNIAILEDPLRKNLFIKAIEETVTPDDVVLDLGTGSGILAIAAARAGARHVYALEPARSGDLAAKVIAHNGYADRVTMIRGWSTTTELPERATVLTTDIVGNDCLDMVIWENLQDARRRLLTPDARLIPDSFESYVYLAAMPEDMRARHRVLPEHISRWQDRFGIDFSPMLEEDLKRVAGFYERPERVREWEPLSEPVPLYNLSLHGDVRKFSNTVTVPVSRPGVVNAAIVFFKGRIGPTTYLSTAPWDGGDRSHWFTAGWAFAEGHHVRPGDELTLTYHYEGDGRARIALDGEGTL